MNKEFNLHTVFECKKLCKSQSEWCYMEEREVSVFFPVGDTFLPRVATSHCLRKKAKKKRMADNVIPYLKGATLTEVYDEKESLKTKIFTGYIEKT